MDSIIIKNENSPLEEKMEEALKKAGLRYKSQYSIEDKYKDKWNSKYILDFVVYGDFCKIVVECDGTTYHSSQKAQEHDLKRDLWVKAYKEFDDTLRFNTKQIMNNIESVIEDIKKNLSTYDKLYLDKKQKAFFDPKKIPNLILKDDLMSLSRSFVDVFSLICKDAQKNEKNKEKRKKIIVKEVIKVLNQKGFKRIDEYFAYFSLEKLSNVRHEFDYIFGAFNTPCTLSVIPDISKLKMSNSIANDSSILKIILIYDSGLNRFKGKSFLVIDGLSEMKNSKIRSDILFISNKMKKNPTLDKYKEIDELENLLGKVKKLEDELKISYETLYKSPSYRKSMNIEPFINLETHQKERLIISITQFLHYIHLNGSLNEHKSSDITVKWLKEEGFYFQNLKFTFHELTLAIHYLRKQFS